MAAKRFDRHHVVPRSRGGTNHPLNIIRLERGFHEAFHRVFDNRTPIEQVQRLLETNAYALTVNFRERVGLIITDFGEKAYEDGVFDS
jgi:hypothetical protein